jgi:hypothetical protein
VAVFHHGRLENFNGWRFDKRNQPHSQPKQDGLSRHEIWRLTYRKAPYLRHLSETEFLAHTGRVLSSFVPHFIKGRVKLPHEKVLELLIAWTHALEEAEFRRLDMKKLREYIHY